MPWNLSPERRCQLVMTRMTARVIAFDFMPRPPRVPPGVAWKLTLSIPPVLSPTHPC
jgi:hypothetical protein